jgi:chromosome partitioning protein
MGDIHMATTFSFVNLKGGVGKTALAVNFAAFCGKNGFKTLLIDTDPQTNATFSCITVETWKAHSKEKGTIANLMGMRRHTSAEGSELKAQDVIIEEVFANVDLLPSHLDLFTMDLDLAGTTAREKKLKRSLSDVIDKYEFIVCDCPPNLTIPTQNALAMSTHFIVPVSPDFLSAIGVGILLRRVKEFCDDLEHELENVGLILSRIGRPAKHRAAITDDLRDRFEDLVLESEIKERVVVSEAASLNRSVFQMNDPIAIGEFESCYEEIFEKIGVEI